jgi:hypothetical protein
MTHADSSSSACCTPSASGYQGQPLEPRSTVPTAMDPSHSHDVLRAPHFPHPLPATL